VEKITTIRKVGAGGFQTSVPKALLKDKNIVGVKWIKKGNKVTIELVEGE